jgi:hypothetical protein
MFQGRDPRSALPGENFEVFDSLFEPMIQMISSFLPTVGVFERFFTKMVGFFFERLFEPS